MQQINVKSLEVHSLLFVLCCFPSCSTAILLRRRLWNDWPAIVLDHTIVDRRQTVPDALVNLLQAVLGKKIANKFSELNTIARISRRIEKNQIINTIEYHKTNRRNRIVEMKAEKTISLRKADILYRQLLLKSVRQRNRSDGNDGLQSE